jgi:hypothetical protein
VFWHRYWRRKEGRFLEGSYGDRKQIVKSLCAKAGVKYFRFHPIRHSGEMINVSDVGMVFLAEHESKPGETVDIKILEDAADPAWLEPNHDYSAEVRWCEKSDGEETSNYRVGIRLLFGEV